MATIYATSSWDSNTTYQKYDFIKYNGFNWYSLKSNNKNNIPSTSSTWWGGVKEFSDGNKYPHFLWSLSYGTQVPFNPKVNKVQFGGGYMQRSSKLINNNLLKINVQLNSRSEKEAAAILHFFEKRKGVETFLFTPPSPLATQKRFICDTYSNTYTFFDNFNITATFTELNHRSILE